MSKSNINPKEILERAKLMMGYDTSKTLTENTESLKTINEEKQRLNEAAFLAAVPLWAWIAGGTAAAGGTWAGLDYWSKGPWGDSDAETQIRTISAICDSTPPQQYAYLASVIKKPSLSPQVHAKIAADIAKASQGWGTDEDLIYKSIDTIVNKGTMGDWCAARIEHNPGNPKALEELLIDELDGSEQTEISGKLKQIIAKSKKKITTKDDITQEPNYWIDKFPCLRLTNSFPNNWDSDIVQDRFGFTSVPVVLKNNGQITNYRLQSDGKLLKTNGDYTGYKIECGSGKNINTIEESVSLKKKYIREQGEINIGDGSNNNGSIPSPNPNPRPRGTTYKDCEDKDFQTYGCKSSYVKRAQECIKGLVPDGKWGKNTNSKLSELGYGAGFNKNDVEDICSKALNSGMGSDSNKSEPGKVKTYGNSERGKEGPSDMGDNQGQSGGFDPSSM